MNKSNIRWTAFPRDELPGALLGASRVDLSGRNSFEPYDLRNGNVVVGFPDSRKWASYNPPCVFVVDDESAAETLSWLRVYSPATFPLSQFGRVVSAHDWRRFDGLDDYPTREFRHDRWSSVIVGEALAQSEADVELAQLPLSRASACFTTAIARAASIHRSDEATRACADRLAVVEGDHRFARRLVSVSDLIPVWSIVDAQLDGPLPSPSEAAELVLQAAEGHLSRSTTRGGLGSFTSLRGYPEFDSDSIEYRVVAFQRLVNELMHATDRRPRNSMPDAILAAAAFKVGRGTSHAFLLHQIGKLFPTSQAWFGLMAALAGVEAWDADWTRAAKGVEKQVRSDFRWTDVSGFDLCWVEFAWLAGTFEGPDVFATMPKLAARAISVELVPGVACQFRLASGADAESRVGTVVSERENELRAALEQFLGLASRTRQLLEGRIPPTQQSFRFDGEINSYPKGGKAKRSKPSEK